MLCSGSDSPCPEEPWCRAELSLLLVPEALKILAGTVLGVFLDPLPGQEEPVQSLCNSLE